MIPSNVTISATAYDEAIESGIICRSRADVLRAALKLEPGFTIREIGAELPGHLHKNVAARAIELQRMGILQKVDVKECPVTGAKAGAYRVTGDKPVRIPTRMNHADLMNLIADFIEGDYSLEERIVEQLNLRLRGRKVSPFLS